MSTELALNTIDSTLSIWNDNEHLQEIRKLFAPTLSDIEFQIYVGMGKSTGLNPFLKEIWAVKFGKDKDGNELPAQIFIGRDGYRKGAQSHPEYDFHQSDAVYENDKFDVNNGVINHSYGLTNRGKLIGAYCMTKRKSASKPQFVFCELEEYTTGQALWAEVQWKDNKYGGKYKQGGKPATMIKKCFDCETEVLTDQGFQRFDSVTGKILEITETGLNTTDSIPFHQDYSGEMIQYDGQYLNFSVTPNHTMITTNGKIDADDLLNKATKCYRDAKLIPSNFQYEKDDYEFITDDQIKLAAYFIADGSHTGFRQLRIAVSRKYKVDALNELNSHSNLTIKKAAGNTVESHGRIIHTNKDYQSYTYDYSLIEEICNKDKTLNIDILLNFSQRQAILLIDALVLFDGHISNSNTKRFYTSRLDILRQIEVVAIIAGYAVNVPTVRYSDISNNPGYFIVISEKKSYPVVSFMEKKSGIKKISENKSGKVWCVTVPSGMIIVRRNGFSMICGNCAESQCLRLAFQDMFGGTYGEEEMQYDPNTATVDNDTGKKLTKAEMVDKMQSSKNKPIVVNPEVAKQTTIENPITQEQIEKIESLVIQTEFPPDRISKAFAHYKAQILEDFTESNANHFISILEKELDKLSKTDLSDIDPETGEVIQ